MIFDEWVTTALASDEMVVELLLRMKQPMTAAPQLPLPTLAWGIRQRRSKLASAAVRKERDSMMRFSPTTPLSWSYGSAASSPSDDSCRPSNFTSGGRSKGTVSIACASANKRSKRQKSFTEHQEEESLSLKESIHFKNELETMHTLKKQKVPIENLERLKTDLYQQSVFERDCTSYYPKDLNFRQLKPAEGTRIVYVPSSNNINMHVDHAVATNSFKAKKRFILPDLNMMPSKDDSAFDSLNGFS